MIPYRWRIELFGSLRLLREDQVVCTYPPSKVGDLLAYLACQTGRVHTRQELAEHFWPETDNTTGRTRLRQHLTVLRRQLEPDGVAPGGVLRTSRDEVSLDPSSFTTDVADFEDAIRRAEQTGDTAARTALLDKAIGLYRGEFLSGYWEHWILAERERLKERVSGALRELAAASETTEDLPHSIDYAHRLVTADPLCEASHAALIRLLIAARQTAAARRQYKTLEQILKVELGANPLEETRALMEGLPSEEVRSGLVHSVPGNHTSNRTALIEEGFPSSSIQESLRSPDTSETPEPFALSPTPTDHHFAPKRRIRHRRIILASLALILLLTLGLVGRWWLDAHDDNPAHRNFSPAAITSGKQEELWIRRYETKPGDKDSEPTAMVVDKAGNIYVTGFIDTAKNDVDYITIKYALDGKLLWERRYNGTGNDFDAAGLIAVDTEGSVYVTGESFGPPGSGPEEHNQADIVTLKYDGQTGKQIGIARYDGPGHGKDVPCAIALDGKGHVYVLSIAWDGPMTGGADGHGWVLIQYDKNLKPNWIRRYYDSNGRLARGNAMVLDPDGFVYVTGSSGNGFVTRKYDSTGDVKWTIPQSMPQNTVSTPFRILRDHAGNLYVVCGAGRTTGDSRTEAYVQVLKYTRDGVLQRDNTYREDTRTFCCASACNGDSRIYIIGTTNGINKPRSQVLMIINSEGVCGEVSFYGASHGDNHGYGVAADHRNLVHTTGQATFTKSDDTSPLLLNTAATTLTYTMFGQLLRVRRYAGSELLRSLGGRVIAVDDQDNIIVAGQTFGGKSNDLFVLEYPP